MTLALFSRSRPAVPQHDDRAQVPFSLSDLVAALSTGFDHAQWYETMLDRREGRA
ncbi:hypothetical protein ACTTAI_05640 [Rhodobacter capsulatus]|uniref:hypothetical protein n=1 Tax=Rhodobacter capsulatus TaxID=1061 RepID=UPI004028D460